MNMMVLRALRGLKSCLPEAAINAWGHAEDQGRAEGRDLLLDLAYFFRTYDVLGTVTLTPAQDSPQSNGGAGSPQTMPDLHIALGFEVTVDGKKTRVDEVVATDPGALERAFMAKASNAHLHPALVEMARDRCLAVMEQMTCSYLSFFQRKHAFWRDGGVTVTRQQYEASNLRGALDVDAFLSRVRDEDPHVPVQNADLTGAPALWNAATLASVPLRLDAGMDMYACDSNGISPFVAACLLKNDKVVKALLGAGADPNRVDSTGFNAVIAAVAVADGKTVEALVNWGGDPNGPRTMPALLVALSHPSVKMLETLIRCGVDVRATMPDGRRFHEALHLLTEDIEERNSLRGEVVVLVNSRLTELAVQDALAAPDGAPSHVTSKRALAL